MLARNSPWLFAACRVLLRLLMPMASTICPYLLDPYLFPSVVKEHSKFIKLKVGHRFKLFTLFEPFKRLKQFYI